MAAGPGDESDGAVLVARIIVERVLLPDGSDQVRWEAADAGGDELPVIEQVGMLYMVLDGALHAPDE